MLHFIGIRIVRSDRGNILHFAEFFINPRIEDVAFGISVFANDDGRFVGTQIGIAEEYHYVRIQ